MPKVSFVKVAGDTGNSINGLHHAIGTGYKSACSHCIDYTAIRIGGPGSDRDTDPKVCMSPFFWERYNRIWGMHCDA